MVEEKNLRYALIVFYSERIGGPVGDYIHQDLSQYRQFWRTHSGYCHGTFSIQESKHKELRDSSGTHT